jgi:alpha-galactosidase
MQWKFLFLSCTLLAGARTALLAESPGRSAERSALASLSAGALSVDVFNDGSYALRSSTLAGPVLRASIEADLAGVTLRSALYPHHATVIAEFHDELGSGRRLTITHSGLPGVPNLVCRLRLYDDLPWGDIQASVVNTTAKGIDVHAIRAVQGQENAIAKLDGPEADDRVLSDSFSEDGPQLEVMDLAQPLDGMHRAVGSQLIYNRQSHASLLLAALSADRLLTIFHLKTSGQGIDTHIVSYDVTSTGTNEILSANSVHYPAGNDVPLSIRVAAGESLDSERLMFAIGHDHREQLENYGRAIRTLHKARVTKSTPIGWWSWTAYYYGVTQDTMLTNAQWLAQNLASPGYTYFQIDEGYQYARGEYATSDGRTFPRGVGYIGQRATAMGLTFGVWVAPFQVSERSWVYQYHPEWLVHTRDGKPVHLGKVAGNFDELYALDSTHPGAQDYLRYTYRTLVREWNVHFIKMDFMDSAAVEGVFFRPNTTALEAQRIGLQVIRDTVGDDVVLDKDGSPMLTPVGLVDAGRTSQDTGHTFESTRDAASGVIARFYMNRNFYITDPDAFTVSKQIVADRGWHGNKTPLTLDEAEVSIALSAVSGGMFEIGDDLPTLGSSPERLALVRNPDLLNMAKLGRASIPLDLMTYLPADKQPSVLALQEDRRQKIVTIFNWTDGPRSHTLSLRELGLNGKGPYTATDVLRAGAVPIRNGALSITQPAHSVRMLKLIDTSSPDVAPSFEARSLGGAVLGNATKFEASESDEHVPVLRFRWDFGDGVTLDGAHVEHAYTYASQYKVSVTAFGLGGATTEQILPVTVTGAFPTAYDPGAKQRPQP